jgi:hypothetical protein
MIWSVAFEEISLKVAMSTSRLKLGDAPNRPSALQIVAYVVVDHVSEFTGEIDEADACDCVERLLPCGVCAILGE